MKLFRDECHEVTISEFLITMLVLFLFLLSAVLVGDGRVLAKAKKDWWTNERLFDPIQVIYQNHRYSTRPVRGIKKYSVKRGKFKSYMDYRKITDRTTAQYRLLKRARTDVKGFRKYKGRYCVAVGSRFCRNIGTKLDIRLSTGVIIRCILADQKQDADTDKTNSYHKNDGSVVEFLVNTSRLKKKSRLLGDVSCYKKLKGKVQDIYVYKRGTKNN